jgi:hypothetical protein
MNSCTLWQYLLESICNPLKRAITFVDKYIML